MAFTESSLGKVEVAGKRRTIAGGLVPLFSVNERRGEARKL